MWLFREVFPMVSPHSMAVRPPTPRAPRPRQGSPGPAGPWTAQGPLAGRGWRCPPGHRGRGRPGYRRWPLPGHFSLVGWMKWMKWMKQKFRGDFGIYGDWTWCDYNDRMVSIKVWRFLGFKLEDHGKNQRLMMFSGVNHQQPATRKKTCLDAPSSICLGRNHEQPRGLFDKN